jgi:hypothetical protein
MQLSRNYSKQRSVRSSKLGSNPPKASHKNSLKAASSSFSSELLLASNPEDAASDKDDAASVSDDDEAVVIQGGDDKVVSQEQEFSKLVSAPMMIFAAGRGGLERKTAELNSSQSMLLGDPDTSGCWSRNHIHNVLILLGNLFKVTRLIVSIQGERLVGRKRHCLG